MTPASNISVTQFLTSVFDPLEQWERAAVLRTWRQVPYHENYEMLQNNYGEIAGAYGLALIIVDNTLPRSTQFSLVVFIRRPKNKYDFYWIFKNDNLSRVSISRSSGSIMVDGQREDGAPVNCHLAWSRKDNKWTCVRF